MSQNEPSEKEKTKPAAETIAEDAVRNSASVDPLIGRQVGGRYVIERVLGQGGMGVVYACRHKTLNKKFVIKIIRMAQFDAGSNVALRRFKREAQAIARVEHPNVVQVVDYDVLPDNTPYIVMEYIEGQDLEQFMTQYPEGMPADLFRGFMNQLCDAMETVHACGIVHRDLKPSNIMVQQTGNAFHLKILDFGLASLTGPASETAHVKLTAAGQILGTPAYMAPEQCRELDVSEQTDIYALGLIAHEMLTGQPAIRGRSFLDVIRKQIREVPRPVREVRSDIPVEFSDALESALQKRPEDRLTSMSLFRKSLGDAGDGNTASGFTTSFHTVRPKSTRPSWLTAIGKNCSQLTKRLPSWVKWVGIAFAASVITWLMWPDGDRAGSAVDAQSPDAPGALLTEKNLFERSFERIGDWPMEHHSKPVDFIPEATKLVTVTETGLVKIWDYQTGMVVHRVRPFDEGLQDVLVSSTGQHVLVVSAEGLHTAWIDLETHEIGYRDLWDFLDESERIVDVTRVDQRVYRQGDARIALLTSKRLRLFEAGPQGAPVGELDLAGTSPMGALEFSHDGRFLALVNTDRVLSIFDVKANRVVLRDSFEGKGWMQSMAFSDDARFFALGTRGNEVMLYDVEQAALVATNAHHDSWVVALWFLPQNQGLLSYSVAGDFHRLRLPNLEEEDRADIGGRKLFLFGSTGMMAATDTRTKKLGFFRFLDPHLSQQFTLPQTDVWAMTMSPDGKTVLTGSPDATIVATHVAEGETRTLTGHLDGVTCLDITRDGRTLVSASDDFSLALWDLPAWKLIKRVPAHQALVNAVVLSPRQDRCVTTSSDRSIKLWSFPQLEEIYAFPAMNQAAQGLAVSPSGERIAAGDWSGRLVLINLADRSELASARICNRPIYWIEFFPHHESKMLCSTLGGGGTLVVTFEHGALVPRLLTDLASLVTPTVTIGKWPDRPSCFAVLASEVVQIYDGENLTLKTTIKGLPGVQIGRFHPQKPVFFCVLGGGHLWSYELPELWLDSPAKPTR